MTRSIFLIMILSLAFASGCASQNKVILQIQFCLGDDEGVRRFKNELAAIGREEGLEFVDGSDSTKRGMNIKVSPVVYVSLERNGSVAVMAGNLFLPKYQIYMSFFSTGNLPEARRLASKARARLSTLFAIQELPLDKGAIRMAECSPTGELVK